MNRFYPTSPARRRRAVLADVAVVVAVIGFVAVAWWLHRAVAEVAVLADGVEEAGLSVQGSFDQAADTVRGVPLIGGELARALQAAGRDTGGRVAELGVEGRRTVERTARTVAVVTFMVPTVVLLAVAGPRRWRQVQRLRALDRMLVGADDPGRWRLIASWAVFSLPPEQLLRFTPDPFGDLLAERYEPLVAAAFADSGLTGCPSLD
jgi:hypothetical protein